METLPLLWPRKAAAACELPRFHHDPDSGGARLRFLRRKLTVNQAAPGSEEVRRGSTWLSLTWNDTQELLESHRSDAQIHVNRHKLKKNLARVKALASLTKPPLSQVSV